MGVLSWIREGIGRYPLFGLLLAPVLGAAAALPGPAARPDEEALLRFNNLGIAYLAQYKPAEAERQFRQAVALDPNYAVGHVNVGIAAAAQVRYEDAIASFRRALALDPGNVYAHFNLSLIFKAQGKAEEAREEAIKASAADPRDPDIRYQIGSLHYTLRQFDKAIQELETVLKLDPNFLSAYYSLGRAYISKGNIEAGKRYIEKHRDLQAGAGATPAVGLKYGEQGRYSYAMEDTGTEQATPALAPGQVRLVEVTAGSGLDFSRSAEGSVEDLRKPGAPADLRSRVAPLLGGGVAVADVDGDGREDLFLTGGGSGGSGSTLYLNRGGMKFESSFTLPGPAMSAAFGDLDGDADPDLVVSMVDRVRVFLNDGKGTLVETGADAGVSGVPITGVLGGVTLADVDHDGDLDIFVAGFLADPAGSGVARGKAFPSPWVGMTNLLFRNVTAPPSEAGTAGAVRFEESAAKASVGDPKRRSTGAVFSDFDNDRDIDFVIASPGDGTAIFSNQRNGSFVDLGEASGLQANAPAMGVAVADYNKDGWMDLALSTFDGSQPRLFRNMMGDLASGSGGRAFALDVAAFADVSRQMAVPQFGIAFLDLDNDGYLDLVTVNGSDIGPALFVYRNVGTGRFIDGNQLLGVDAVRARGGRGLAAADLDLDGDLDLVVANAQGAPTLLRNDGGNRNHWLRVAPAGLHSNRPAVGTKVEIKSGRLWQKTEVEAGSGYMSQSSLVPHFGLGRRDRVDALRLLWPGGVLQDEIQVEADAVFAVQELDRKGSSCPILYAWNGREIAFVSDFLGGSAIGYRTGIDSFNYPDTDEYVKIRGDQLVPRDGMLELRLTNQLEETIFFDRVRLLAVDHPADIEIFPDEKLMPAPPFPPFRLFAVRDAHPPAQAWDDSGRDLLPAISRVDRVYAAPPDFERTSRRFKGYAPEHGITLDLGPLPAGSPVVLLLHGWIDYADSTSNLAAAQAGLSLVPPYLEVLDESAAGPDGAGGRVGQWVRVLPQIGFPAGLPKTMTVDLTGALLGGARIVRIGTSMRIHWDEIRVATQIGPAPSLTGLEAERADLRYRGFPALASPDGRPPELYDYARDRDSVHWMTQVGDYTRYGDVRPLLSGIDDRYVITRPGDEIALAFRASALPPLPAGWTRDYLLFADGFGKDMDINSARPHGVAPLPFHGMSAYPPPPGQPTPFESEALMDYLDRFNTRRVQGAVGSIKAR